jgi:hypothetical protein
MPKKKVYKYRYQLYVARDAVHNRCTQKVNSNHGVYKCPNVVVPNKEGMCVECYNWNLKQKGIYPHKDNDISLVDNYLIL